MHKIVTDEFTDTINTDDKKIQGELNKLLEIYTHYLIIIIHKTCTFLRCLVAATLTEEDKNQFLSPLLVISPQYQQFKVYITLAISEFINWFSYSLPHVKTNYWLLFA